MPLQTSSWQVELQCPQCGGPATLAETDRIFSCGYCKVRLGVSYGGGHFRYYLAPGGGADDSREILYVPYWRFKGIAFACRGENVEERFIDASVLAGRAPLAPMSLGFRPQALKLRMASPTTPGKFLATSIPLGGLLSRLITQIDHAEGEEEEAAPLHHQSFLGETASVIYAPVYMEGEKLYDAVLHRPIGRLLTEEEGAGLAGAGNGGAVGADGGALSIGASHAPCGPIDAYDGPFDDHRQWQIRFNPMMCPHCGWDLSGEADARAMLCTNCGSGWELPDTQGGALGRLRVAVLAGDSPEGIYLPFWRMRMRVEGLALETYADLAMLCNLPKAIRPEWREQPLHFWLPAFRTSPRQVLKLARAASVFQPGEDDFLEDLPKAELFPVTLSRMQAAQAIKPAIAFMGVPKKTLFPKLSGLRVRITGCMLVYVPFTEQGSELIQPAMHASIGGAGLRFARGV
jgi:predicted RNA-binding Zn-ribbon protein involved in translation (DUF1610 family)